MSTTSARRWTRQPWTLRGVPAETFRGFRADRGLDLAGSLAFTTILTAVPLLASLSLVLVTFFRENDDQILSIVNAVLPYQSARLTANLRDFIAESSTISGVGLVLLIIASVRLVFVVEGIFNAVWGAPRRRDLVRRMLIYTFSLVALGLVLGGISWGLRAMRAQSSADSFVNSAAFAAAAPFVLKAFFLMLLFRYLPNARVRLGPAAVAGSSVALGLELLRLGFAVYVAALKRMNLITGSLAFILFAILALYFAWALILLGVELTYVLQTRISGSATPYRREGRAEKAIRMMLTMSTAQAAPLAELETNPDASPVETLAILEQLANAKLIEGDPAGGYRLARSGREISVARIVEALSPELYRINPHNRDRVAVVLEPLFDRIHAERRALLSKTLAELRER
ncbi:MAG TPA: YhjD/YihY/BrkB family envelope integrity protein [Thermoanaerobaculia bacterium]|nr:YhjD/YihY/BrkB family envelope integrity protein [Thermoanaerobaculia bacterium]